MANGHRKCPGAGGTAPRTAAAAAKISEALDVAIEVALDESEQ